MFKHAREFLRYLRNGQYEQTVEGGILMPKAQALFANYYEHDLNGQELQRDPNLLTIEGLTYLLTAGFYNGTKLATWCLSLYGGNYTPTTALTAASYPATASEITSGTEGGISGPTSAEQMLSAAAKSAG